MNRALDYSEQIPHVILQNNQTTPLRKILYNVCALWRHTIMFSMSDSDNPFGLSLLPSIIYIYIHLTTRSQQWCRSRHSRSNSLTISSSFTNLYLMARSQQWCRLRHQRSNSLTISSSKHCDAPSGFGSSAPISLPSL